MPTVTIFNGYSVDSSNKKALNLHQVYLDFTNQGKKPEVVKAELEKIARQKGISLGEPMVRPRVFYSKTGYRRGS